MFTQQNLLINRGRTTCNADGGSSVTVIHTYKDLSATIANIIMSFPDYLGNGPNQDMVFVGDHMLIEGSDTTNLRAIESLAPFTVGPNLFQDAVPSLSVGAPVAATDGNAAKITGTVLQMQIADATHPGILTNIAQDIGGPKTFHADVNIAEPATGLHITKETGSFGQSFTTEDETAVVSIDFIYSPDEETLSSIRYSYGGVLGSGPLQLGIFPYFDSATPSNSIGMVLDANGEVRILNSSLVVREIDPITPGEFISVGQWDFNDSLFRFPNAVSGIDIFSAVPNSLTYLCDSGDYFGYNVTTDAFFWNIGGNPVFGLNATSGLQTDIGLDRLTGGTLNIGNTNATSINLAQNTTIPVGKTLTANGGVIFGNGGSNLNDYEATTFAPTFTNGALSAGPITLDIVRIGNQVTITCRTAVTTGPQGSPGTGFYALGSIPVDFRISSGTAYTVIIVKNDASTYSASHAAVDSAGNLILSANFDGTSTFTSGVSNTVQPFSLTYTI